MGIVTDILLLIALFNMGYVLVIMTRTNIKFRSRRAFGGKKFLVITDIIAGEHNSLLHKMSELCASYNSVSRIKKADC